MIDPTEIVNRQTQINRTGRMMWIMFLLAACGIILVAHKVQPPPSQSAPSRALNEAFVAIAASDLLLLAFLRRKLLARSRELAERGETNLAPSTWLGAQMLGFASAMSVILFGFMLHTVGALPPWFSTGFYIAGFAAFIFFRPQPVQD